MKSLRISCQLFYTTPKPILSRFACYQVEWGSSGIMDKIYRLMSYTKEVFPLNWSLNDINAGYTWFLDSFPEPCYNRPVVSEFGGSWTQYLVTKCHLPFGQVALFVFLPNSTGTRRFPLGGRLFSLREIMGKILRLSSLARLHFWSERVYFPRRIGYNRNRDKENLSSKE